MAVLLKWLFGREISGLIHRPLHVGKDVPLMSQEMAPKRIVRNELRTPAPQILSHKNSRETMNRPYSSTASMSPAAFL